MEPDTPRHDALELLRRFGKAFNRANIDGILACVTDDFEWRQAAGPDAPDGRIARGEEDVRAALAARDANFQNVRYSETDIIYGTDGRIVGLFRMTGDTADGRPIDQRGVDVYEIRDGKIARKDSYWKRIG